MKIIRKKLSLSESEYYRTHLRIITSLMPVSLTNRELEVLAEFMSFKGVSDRFGTDQRRWVMDKLNIKAPNLTNLLKTLEFKGVIKDGAILPVFLPNVGIQGYEFLLEVNKS